jgi:hypothetical protein
VQEPPELCCPITHSLMLDCVTADDGNNYSRAGIEEWFAKGKTSCYLCVGILGESPIFRDSHKQIHHSVI